MAKPTFLRLPDARRRLVVDVAVAEFAERSYAEASLSRIARRSGVAKGSFYQYFADKLDLYRYLLEEEAPRRKREFLGEIDFEGDFWGAFARFVERGMAFLVEQPAWARLAAVAAAPTANAKVRGLYLAICEAGDEELRALLRRGVASGAMTRTVDLDIAAQLVASVIGPGLTEVVLRELGAPLHEVLKSDALRRKLDRRRIRRLAHAATTFLRHGLGTGTHAHGRKGK
jgi:AcrR family transcriptional regulator